MVHRWCEPLYKALLKSLPIPVVNVIANAPQNVTRAAPTRTAAPPARAANAPKRAKNPNEIPATHAIREEPDTRTATMSGIDAPIAKLDAEASEAWMGRACGASQIPNSSRACAPSASWAISCSATCFARAGARPRAT